ncbi:MAG: winged helix-turn-helix transcriptional regulator [Candidatus Competibacteraceae bacterium]|nr:winged helix-turn-helix transcriptional regulator [Candidatus Competibacteraceae bacterium]
MSEEKKIFQLHADVCKALGHPLRIQIIDLLQHKSYCFTELMALTGEQKSNLSQHLSVMTQKGILKVSRKGAFNYYALSSPKVAKACRLMREVLIENLKKNHILITMLNS